MSSLHVWYLFFHEFSLCYWSFINIWVFYPDNLSAISAASCISSLTNESKQETRERRCFDAASYKANNSHNISYVHAVGIWKREKDEELKWKQQVNTDDEEEAAIAYLISSVVFPLETLPSGYTLDGRFVLYDIKALADNFSCFFCGKIVARLFCRYISSRKMMLKSTPLSHIWKIHGFVSEIKTW